MESTIELGAQHTEGSPARRVVAMSHDGKHTLSTAGDVVLVNGRALVSAAGVVAAGLLDGATWIVTEAGGEHTLHRWDGTGTAGPVSLGRLGANVEFADTRIGLRSALIEGDRAVFAREREGQIEIEPLDERGRDRRVLIGGRGVAARRNGEIVFLRPGVVGALALPSDLASATVTGGAMVLDGAAAMIALDSAGRRSAIVYDLRGGAVRARIRLGEARILAVAERKGLIVLGHGSHIALFDLRAARCVGERILPAAAAACAIDADGRRLVVATEPGRVWEFAVSITEWSGAARISEVPSGDRLVCEPAPARASAGERASAPTAEADPQLASSEGRAASSGDRTASAHAEHGAVREQPVSSAGQTASCDDETAAREQPAWSDARTAAPEARAVVAERAGGVAPSRASLAELDEELAAAAELRLIALRPATARTLSREALDEYLADARRWIGSLCRTALAMARDTGWIADPDGTAQPIAAELEAVIGDRGGRAAEACEEAHAQERDAAERFSRWNRRGAPHVEVARELGLSPMATTLLLLAAAPQIWGELARAYGLCVADSARPLVDELLLAHLLEAETSTRSAIGRELDEDAALVASGAVEVSKGLRPYAAIAVHPAIARRLAGAPPPADPDDSTPAADRTLPEIIGPRAAIAAAARALARPWSAPVRIVLRGRSGVGRRTVAAALAAQAGRRLGLVTVEGAAADVEALRQRLRDIALRGDLPCVAIDGLAEDPALRARIRAVIDAHRGPVFIRAPRTGELPVEPGHVAIDLAPLTETERRMAWERTLAGHALDVAPAASLASRFSVGPGAMARACAAAAEMRRAQLESARRSSTALEAAELEAALATALRQHRSVRIEAIATRVERLASWDDLIVPEDIADTLHELCARVHHRRTVLEDWGLSRVAATAQGVTALFQGGPGTGKTMAAEVVARALGYELWRVDLSKVVSKWIGETEKNLAAVFDAAEDGEIVLLFDEADSLFGKRTEIKSSNDRNANLETNYLLQRLDSFTGVAILTTNFGTSIDSAFRRRLSIQAQFPFPDEVDRERLWRAHLPRKLPVAGDLDLGALARKYELSGGYIRNAVLRAAYLAARRGAPLSAADLERAVRSEYLACGKVSATGALN